MIAKFFLVSVWVSELNLKDLRFCKRLAVGFVFMLSSSFLSENNLIYKSYIPLTRYITDILARGATGPRANISGFYQVKGS